MSSRQTLSYEDQEFLRSRCHIDVNRTSVEEESAVLLAFEEAEERYIQENYRKTVGHR